VVDNDRDIISIDWISECIDSKKLLPLSPRLIILQQREKVDKYTRGMPLVNATFLLVSGIIYFRVELQRKSLVWILMLMVILGLKMVLKKI
jgi:uncharacterized membrane protein SirB2